MTDGEPSVRPEGPYRLTTRRDAHWTTPVPWAVVVPLLVVLAYLLLFKPPSVESLVPAAGVALAIVVAALPGLVSFTPDVAAWTHRSATIGPDGVLIDMPGRGTVFVEWERIGSIVTRPMSLGLEIPPTIQLMTDVLDRDGARIAELTIHHSSYSYSLRRADVNVDGPALLAALEATPCAEALDVASATLVELVFRTGDGAADGLSARTVRELDSGRLWNARRSAAADGRDASSVPVTLVRLDYLLKRDPVLTARRATVERPNDPVVRYYLAHALLDSVGKSRAPGPQAVKHRLELRQEARELLEGLLMVPAYAPVVARELRAMDPESPPQEG
jgi:hypothetical protein